MWSTGLVSALCVYIRVPNPVSIPGHLQKRCLSSFVNRVLIQTRATLFLSENKKNNHSTFEKPDSAIEQESTCSQIQVVDFIKVCILNVFGYLFSIMPIVYNTS